VSDVVIRAEGLGKKYIIGHEVERERYVALRDVMTRNARNLWRKTADMVHGRAIVSGDAMEEFWALKDVSFEVKRGEVIGVIGRNGAGKSTLLKVLSRITEPSEGRVTIKGHVASLLEVGTGFHPELTGRENIYLNGAILGMTRAEIKRKFEEIVDFAEVEKFLDTPVKRYSSGMYVRLAFAVAAHLEPEILIVDEVLAVGDAEFQKKCLGKMRDVAAAGRTVLFVSHNMNAVERLCQRVMWLDRAKLAGQFNDPRQGITAYLSGIGGECRFEQWSNTRNEFDNPYFKPTAFWVESRAPKAVPGQPFSNKFPITVRIAGEVKRVDPSFNIGIALYGEDGSTLLWSNLRDVPEAEWVTLRPGAVDFRVQIPPRFLNEGIYRLEMMSSLHCRAWFHQPGVNAPLISFSIRGGLSDSPYWDFRRPGFFAPVWRWDAQSQSTTALFEIISQ